MGDPRFTIGDVIHHKKFDYRGVIADVDPEFNGTEAWYEKVATSRPPKDAPWYTVLVHGQQQVTYVAERHLESDDTDKRVEHPAMNELFDSFENGRYHIRQRH